ncbi:glycine dehydrogenase subunit 1 [Parelusimicrobium proximum]|uniref:aminomethyl-transferring glycine dehydrogenase subunit GcvPA n=1 Tax=Parelusimicrobium proximum TaxID=3228953 RepID=UPI003D16280D
MFITNTEKEQKEMLDAMGVKSIKDLLKDIPSDLLYPKIEMGEVLDENALSAHMQDLADKNKKLLNFTGAGVYEHFIPAAVNAISGRGEFLTAYTPYQAEASQGTLQAIYEYQSNICSLFDMDASNASHYDGATALAEAVSASCRIKAKNKILIPQALNPHYKRTLNTYFKNSGIYFEEVNHKDGALDLDDLKAKLVPEVAAFVLATPNFFGAVEDAEAVSAMVKEAGVLLIALVNPISLGALSTPGSYGADFAVAEGQSLGNAMNFGGPLLGIFTCKKEHVRHTPGRIAGIAKDKDGNRAFVLTLQAREQHIRRERATSNICSNEALCALNAAIYLTLMGPDGMKQLAEINLHNAHVLKDKIAKLKNYKIKFSAPFFNEFVVETPLKAEEFIKTMAEQDFGGGYSLSAFGKEFEKCVLLCATETKTEAQMDKLVCAMEEVK